MAKTNFTKVEEMLGEGLRKMAVEHLLDQTEISSKKGSDQTASKDVSEKENNLRLKILLSLQRDLKFLDKAQQEPYSLFGITKKTLLKHLKHPEAISTEEWGEIIETQSKVKTFRKDFEKNSSSTGNIDDDLINQQRRSQITKRFNINEKWLPLY